MPKDIGSYIKSRTVAGVGGCWIWQGTKNEAGYGRCYHQGRKRAAHRVSYETFVGPIPEELTIDHLCRVTSCVNPEHLEPVTLRENIHRSPLAIATKNASKTQCPKGHPYDDVNTSHTAGRRVCRICRRTRVAAHRERQRNLTAAIAR